MHARGSISKYNFDLDVIDSDVEDHCLTFTIESP